jgi:muconolactone delta-isomerase
MLFMLKAHLEKPAGTSNKEFYGVWKQEAEAALAALKAGAIKALYKAAGTPDVIAILDLSSADDLDHAIAGLPIWRLGYSHIVTKLEITALRPYQNWAEDLNKLAE